MAHVAVDAKSILNTGLSRHTHVQNIHATLGQQLLLHDTTDNESRWVKHHFYEFLAQLKSLPLLKDKQILLTGDGLYNNQNTRVGERFAGEVIRAAKEGRLLYRDAYQLTGLHGATFERYSKHLGFDVL